LTARSEHHPADSATAAALRVRGLRKSYGEVLAVNGVSFEVAAGEILGLLGPNGAGKTTIINTILAVLRPDSGSIRIGDLDVSRQRSLALARTNFAAVYASLPGNLTVVQNLTFFGLIYRVRFLRRRIEELLRQFQLEALRNTKCGVLSSGELTRVALAKSLLNRPRLLLLDEPTASLDPAAARDTRSTIRTLVHDTHCGVLWTSHNMYEVEEVCDRVLFLSHGQVLVAGDPRSLPREHGARNLEELFIQLAREPLAHPAEHLA
jgi:ABC-2 type transport system ATP-binding protein